MMRKVLFIFLGVLSLNAFAFDPTQGALQNDPSLCEYGYNPNCNYINGSSSPKKIINTTIIHKASRYGALAMDATTGVTGGVVNANSKAEAEKQAIRQCSDNGKNKHCKVLSWVRNGCIAAAEGRVGKTWKLSAATGIPNRAESAAMGLCKKSGASNCRIVVPESCSIPEGMYD